MRALLGAAQCVLSIVIGLTIAGCGGPDTQNATQNSDPAVSARTASQVGGGVLKFDTDEGTWMSVDVSPDGSTIVFNLLGDLYLLPIEGGEATRLTSGFGWDVSPRYSPDGSEVFFNSDRAGFENIWAVTIEDGSLRRVSEDPFQVLGGMNWSHDHRSLLFGRGLRRIPTALLSMDTTSGSAEQVYPPTEGKVRSSVSPGFPLRLFSGVQSNDGSIYFSNVKSKFFRMPYSGSKIYRFSPATNELDLVTPEFANYDEFMPLISHNGELMVYFRQYADRTTELRQRNLETGIDTRVAEIVDHDDPNYSVDDDFRPTYAFTPDDESVVFSHAGKILRVRLSDGLTETIQFIASVELDVAPRAMPPVFVSSDRETATAILSPSYSPDGRFMVFNAIGFIWVKNFETGGIRRLTDRDDLEFMPSISPDGLRIAFISFDSSQGDTANGRLMVVDLSDGETRTVLDVADATFFSPTWSPDGTKIALGMQPSQRPRGRPPTAPFYGWVNAEGGEFKSVHRPGANTGDARADTGGGAFNHNGRSISFDSSGKRILLSYERAPKNEIALVAVSLDGEKATTLVAGDASVLGMHPSPDLRHIIVSDRGNGLTLVPFTEGETNEVGADEGRSITVQGSFHIRWIDNEEVSFGLGRRITRYNAVSGMVAHDEVVFEYPRVLPTYSAAYIGARIITLSGSNGAGQIIESGTLLTDGQRIVSVGELKDVDIPPEAIVIDVSGRTIIPGLMDTHYHSMGTVLNPFPSEPGVIDRTAIAYGITAVWDPGLGYDDAYPAVADMRSAGRIVGPRVSHSTRGAITIDSLPSADTFEKVARRIDEWIALGVTTLKEYNSPSRQQRRWIAKVSRERGIGVVSHTDSIDSLLSRIVDGYTGGDHPSMTAYPVRRDVAELITRTGFVWTPDMYSLQTTIDRPNNGQASPLWSADMYFWETLSRLYPDQLDKFTKFTGEVRTGTPVSLPYEEHRIFRMTRMLSELVAMGGKVGVSGHNTPAINVHQQMWHMWRGGMPAGDVLRAASKVNAEKIGFDSELGSLEPGKVADFLILRNNPLDNMIHTLSVEYTVKGGIIYDASTVGRVSPDEFLLEN